MYASMATLRRGVYNCLVFVSLKVKRKIKTDAKINMCLSLLQKVNEKTQNNALKDKIEG